MITRFLLDLIRSDFETIQAREERIRKIAKLQPMLIRRLLDECEIDHPLIDQLKAIVKEDHSLKAAQNNSSTYVRGS